jgi:hypothetical protein
MPSSVSLVLHEQAALCEGDIITGTITLTHDKPMRHDGISVVLTGMTVLEATTKLVGLLDALAAQPDPIVCVHKQMSLAPPGGTLLPPRNVFDFVIPLVGNQGGQPLLETYRGRLVRTSYVVSVDITRGMTKRTLSASSELAVIAPGSGSIKSRGPIKIKLSRELVPSEFLDNVPRFLVDVDFKSLDLELDQLVAGYVVVHQCQVGVEAVYLQIVSFEHLTWDEDDDIWQENEVQTCQIAQGDVDKNKPIPFCVSVPRFTCAPSVACAEFAVRGLYTLTHSYNPTPR